MTLGAFSFLGYTLAFAGGAVLLLWMVARRRGTSVLADNRSLLLKQSLVLAVAGTVLGETTAQALGAWRFNPDTMLGIWIIGAPVEDLVYGFLVATAIGSATLLFLRKFHPGEFKGEGQD